MKIDIHKPEVGASPRLYAHKWSLDSEGNSRQQELQPSTWVKLLELPSPFSFDEALLLCQNSQDEWLAWIPDYGEAVLHTRQFCLT